MFCHANNGDPFDGETTLVLRFLSSPHERNATYGTLNSARSAISLITRRDVANDPFVKRFFKGVFRLRPNKPKYIRTWDVSIVLAELEKWWPLTTLSLITLSKRLVVLIALTTAQRPQTLANIKQSTVGLEIEISDLIKTSRPRAPQPLLELPFMQSDVRLCVPTTVTHYIQVTTPLRRGEDRLNLSTTKPHRAASSETIARWLEQVLVASGIAPVFFPVTGSGTQWRSRLLSERPSGRSSHRFFCTTSQHDIALSTRPILPERYSILVS